MADSLNISPEMIDNLVNMLKSGIAENSSIPKPEDTNNSNESNSFNGIDFKTIMKIKSIMDTLNDTNSQDSNLLYSLKPYLRKSRQAKLDQYVNLLKISQLSKLFNQKGDGN